MAKEQSTAENESKKKGCNPLSPFLWTLRQGNRFLIKPAAKKADEELDVKFLISRRDFLKAMGVTGGVSFFGGMYFWARSGELIDSLDDMGSAVKTAINPPAIVVKDPPFVVQSQYEFYAPFDGLDANKIAAEMQVDAGKFLYLPDAILKKVSAHLDPQILPVLPPETMKRKKIIYKYSFDEKGKQIGWPNVIGWIDAVEAAGNIQAGAKDSLGRPTPNHAQGSMQVMPDHFIEDGITDRAIMRDPDVNMKYGVDTFRGFLGKATEKNPQLKDVQIEVYLKALQGYNAGDYATYAPENELPEEVKWYRKHMERFALTTEIASRLRKRGFSDQYIVKSLNSSEIKARGYAIWSKGHKNYAEYLRLCNAASVPDFRHPGITAAESEELRGFYETYKRGYWLTSSSPDSKQPVQKLTVPLPPALVLYYYAGGNSIASFGDNADPEKWYGMDTKRS